MMTLGEKIQKLRKQNGLSQEALAEKVNVTRQTVSKWELNQSAPDLDFIVQLSKIFNVSADYLIRDEIMSPDELPKKRAHIRLNEKMKWNILAAISILELTAAGICLICDYFTSDALSWSLIAIASMVAAWVVIFPALAAKKNAAFKTLLALCAVPIPLLAVLAMVLKESVIFWLGSCISLVGIAAVWMIYGLFLKFRGRIWCALGFTFLVLIPLPLVILYIVSCFVPQNPVDFTSGLFNSGITLCLSLACFGVEQLHRKKWEEQE